jgi:hypothetical protein
MVYYLYMTRIWFDTSSTVGFDNAAEAANTTDFETNFKSLAYPVSDMENQATVFIMNKTYAQFKALVDGVNILWSDVKCETNTKHYDLYLLTPGPL